MEKRKYIKASGDYLVFSDLLNEDNLFCISRQTYLQMLDTFKTNKNGLQDLPDNATVQVYPLIKVDENQKYDFYDKLNDNIIDFQINRIHWIWLYADPNNQY